MSWDTYRESLIKTGCVDKAAVCGAEDGAVWTQSPEFNGHEEVRRLYDIRPALHSKSPHSFSSSFNLCGITPAEVKSIVCAFKNPEPLRAGGLHLGGIKYMLLQSDDTQIQAKKGSTGVSVAKSNKCIIIGQYRDGQQPGNCRKQVECVRDYLLQNSY